MATQRQSETCEVLRQLKFEEIVPDRPVAGGSVEFKVTSETIDFLKEKLFTVAGDGIPTEQG